MMVPIVVVFVIIEYDINNITGIYAKASIQGVSAICLMLIIFRYFLHNKLSFDHLKTDFLPRLKLPTALPPPSPSATSQFQRPTVSTTTAVAWVPGSQQAPLELPLCFLEKPQCSSENHLQPGFPPEPLSSPPCPHHSLISSPDHPPHRGSPWPLSYFYPTVLGSFYCQLDTI